MERLDSRCLPVRRDRLFGAIVPDPTDRRLRERSVTALRGAHAVVGHPVPLALLPASTQVAEIALDLRRRGLLTGDPVFASDHIDVVIAHRDERLMAALRRELMYEGRAVLGRAAAGGRLWLKATLLNPHIRQQDLDALLRLVTDAQARQTQEAR